MDRSTMLLMGKSTISMAIFNSYVTNYRRVHVFLNVQQVVVNDWTAMVYWFETPMFTLLDDDDCDKPILKNLAA